MLVFKKDFKEKKEKWGEIYFIVNNIFKNVFLNIYSPFLFKCYMFHTFEWVSTIKTFEKSDLHFAELCICIPIALLVVLLVLLLYCCCYNA